MTPIVVVTRDPDASNDYAVFGGEVETYDIDAGRMDLGDEDEFLEWAESHLGAAKRLAAVHPEAAQYIRNTVLSYAEWKGHDNVPAFITLAEQTAI